MNMHTSIRSAASMAAMSAGLPSAQTDFEAAMADYRAKRAASDAMALGTEGEDEAVDAFCVAMDHMIEEVPAPDLSAVIKKIEIGLERCDGFSFFDSYGEAIMADLRRLSGEIDASAPQKPLRDNIFLDENGQPSDRSGSDLRKARPIEQVVDELAPLRKGYAAAFYRACRESGIDLSVMRTKEGEDRLLMGCACDSQEDLRRPRLEALSAQLKRSDRRRNDVIYLINLVGHFADNQPFESVEQAADQLLRAGGRLMVRPDGGFEEQLSYSVMTSMEESWDGYPTKRLYQRYQATLRQKGAREAFTRLVRERGKVHEGSGWIVLEQQANEGSQQDA